MPAIPLETRVAVKIRYNGYIHHAVALLGEMEPDRSSVYIFWDQFPKGYRDEHDTAQIDYVFKTRCIEPDSSGANGWVATEIADFDVFAGAVRIRE